MPTEWAKDDSQVAVVDSPELVRFEKVEYSKGLVAEMQPLMEAHHNETAFYADIPLNPDFGVYERCAANGALRVFTLRVGWILAGYQFFFVSTHPHSKESVQANQDILFLDQRLRKGWTAYRFLKWCGEQLAQEGVQVVYQHFSARHDFGRLLARMGYEHVDQVWGRRLD